MDSPEKPERVFSTLARELKSIALNNINYFQNGKHSHHAKFHLTFSLLYEYLDIGIEPSYLELCRHLTLCSYDFSDQVKGNGYRSLLKVVHKCCLHLLQLCKYISSVRDSILFRKKLYAKELESYVSALGQLRGVLYYSLKLINYCQEGELFADEDKLNNEVADQLVLDVETLCQEPFYGRCLGFQFCDSMYKPVQALAIAMASYSEGYLETSQMMQVASSVFNSGKYFLDPELRAQQVVKVTRTADIKFCKAFWGFSESSIMRQLPMFVCPSVEVNEVITLGPDAFILPLVDGSDTVDITPPCAHTGPGHVYTRLISAQLRDGQHAFRKSSKVKSPPAAKPKAAGLVIHIHGGGFVAQSSKSHEVYLREWAVTIDAPILSVDYSLAPESPFPRALEECFYAYAWAVNNCHLLGSSGEKILIVGDSAGGNLALATAMRAASFGIRSPDSVVCVYPCTVVRYTPSPARLLSLLDPILPVGLVSRCLAAYAGVNEEHPLSTPKMEDVHSHQSLTRIQLGAYETHENDWLIVGEGGTPEGLSHADTSCLSEADTTSDVSDLQGHSSTAGHQDQLFRKSESMFNMGSIEGNVAKPALDARRQSDTEIFSQLSSDGSCVFPAGAKVGGKVHLGQTASRNLCASKPDMGTSFNLDGLQQKAKLMMESAQNLFSSLASFMPSSTFPRYISRNSPKQPIAVHSSPVSLCSRVSSSNEMDLSSPPVPCAENPKADKSSPKRSKSDILFRSSTQLNSDSNLNNKTDSGACEEGKLDAGVNNSNLQMGDQNPSPGSSSSLMDTSLSFATALSSPFTPSEQRIQELKGDCVWDTLETSVQNSEATGENVSCSAEDRDVVGVLFQMEQENNETSIPCVNTFSGIGAGLNCDITADLNADMDTDLLSDIDLQSGINRDLQSGINTDLQPGINTDLQPGINTDLQSGINTHLLSGINTDLLSGINTDLQLAINAGLPLSINTDLQSAINTDLLSDVNTEKKSHVNKDFKFDSNKDLQSVINPYLQSGLSTDLQSGLSKDLQSCLSTDLQSGLSTDLKSNDNTNLPSDINPDFHINPEVYADIMKDPDPPVDICGDQNLEMITKDCDVNQLADVPKAPSSQLDETMLSCGPCPLIGRSEGEVTFLCSGGVSSRELSPEMTAELPDISRWLLEDALQGLEQMDGSPGEFSPVDLCPCNEHPMQEVASPSVSNILGDCVSEKNDLECMGIEQQSFLNKMADSPQLNLLPVPLPCSNDPTCSKLGQRVSSTKDIDKSSTAKPPTTLSLKKSHAVQGSSSPGTPAGAGQTSTSSEASLPLPAQGAAGSRILRSGSAPILSSLAHTPSVAASGSSSSPSAPYSEANLPHFFKTEMSPSDFDKKTFTCHSPLHKLRKAPVVKNPYMSPLLASDELLKGLTRVCIVACHLDPLLDDSVSFARRLRKLDVPIELHLIDDLPHGFLNFALFSYEAKRASDYCGKKIADLLQSTGV